MLRTRHHFSDLKQFFEAADRIDCMATNIPKPPSVPIIPPQKDDGGAVVLERRTQRVGPPQMYQVVMLNDDYTPMEFVVNTIQRFFNKSVDEATRIMLKIHTEGLGVCGIFPVDIAETKMNQVLNYAKEHQHPLQCIIERID